MGQGFGLREVLPSFKLAGWPQAESGMHRGTTWAGRVPSPRDGWADHPSEGGAAAGQEWGALRLIQVKQSLVQHPLCTEVFLFGSFQFIFQVINSLFQLGYRSLSKLSKLSYRSRPPWVYQEESLSLPHICLLFESTFLRQHSDTSGSGPSVWSAHPSLLDGTLTAQFIPLCIPNLPQ